jgi:ferritin-like metal-binding protein YciE
MADVGLDPTVDSLSELYQDLLWNLAASARVMRLKLPDFASAASDPELLALIGDALRRSAEVTGALEAIASRADRPARVHAAELETALSTAARETAGWQAGKARDIALTSVMQTALHLEIPSCDLAMSLAPVVGHATHGHTLNQMWDNICTLDSRLRGIMQSLVGTHSTSEAPTPPTIVAEAEGPR